MFDAAPPPIPPKPPSPPQFGQSNIGKAGDVYARAQKGGLASTIMTSSQGDLTPSLTAKKTLLGQ